MEQAQDNEKRMTFLKEILASVRLLPVDLARMSQKAREEGLIWRSFTQQAITYWFQKDDCPLFSVVLALRALNIHLECSLETQRKEAVSRRKGYTLVTENLQVRGIAERQQDPLLSECIENGGLLSFLAQALLENNLSIPELVRAMDSKERPSENARLLSDNKTYLKIRYWFFSDDIKIQYIYRIADALGWTVTWKARNMTEEETQQSREETRRRAEDGPPKKGRNIFSYKKE